MRLAAAFAVASLASLLVIAPVACGGDGKGDGSSSGASSGSSGTSSSSGASGSSGDNDAAPSTPAIQLIGRWDVTNKEKPKAGWPGSRLVARFNGTGAKVTISSADGGDGNESWFNVLVDGTLADPVKVDGADQEVTVASGLPAGTHTIELEKRTEPKWGTVTIESITFDGGELLAPPPRPGRRIEYLAESTIDGFGVEGDVNDTCNGEAPAKFDNARKSLAFYAASALSAEHHLIAYSGKGVVKNDDGTTEYLPGVYTRTLPDVPASSWDFESWTPDVVVLSLGGTDMGGATTVPTGFQAAYDKLVTSIRDRHANAHIMMVLWSQIKGDTREALRGVLDAIKAAHAGDAKLHVFQFGEADYPQDETGCYEHATDAHHKETASELVTAIKAATGW